MLLKNDLTNKKFNNLTVIKFIEKKDSRNLYLCRCNCGQEKIVSAINLKSNRVKSCGCLLDRSNYPKQNRHPNFKGYGELSLYFFHYIKNQAIRRKIYFEVSIEELWNLFICQNRKCALSGVDLNFDSRSNKSDRTASLDRIDSSKGYIFNNVQWVHKNINLAKRSISNDDFIKICKQVSEHNYVG